MSERPCDNCIHLHGGSDCDALAPKVKWESVTYLTKTYWVYSRRDHSCQHFEPKKKARG